MWILTATNCIPWSNKSGFPWDPGSCDVHSFRWGFAIATCWHRGVEPEYLVDYPIHMCETFQPLRIVYRRERIDLLPYLLGVIRIRRQSIEQVLMVEATVLLRTSVCVKQKTEQLSLLPPRYYKRNRIPVQ